MNVPMSRPPIARFQRIARMLASGSYSARRLAAALEVSAKTVERDIEFMRDQLGIEIESSRQGYELVRRQSLCPCCARPITARRADSQ